MSVCLFEYGSGDMDSGAIDHSYLGSRMMSSPWALTLVAGFLLFMCNMSKRLRGRVTKDIHLTICSM